MDHYSLDSYLSINKFLSRFKANQQNLILIPYVICLLIFAFSGCAIQTPVPDDSLSPRWEKNKLGLEQIDSWNMRGRVAIQLDKESGSASLNWKQVHDDYVIKIIAPFGKGSLELVGNLHGVTMRDANNQLQHASKPETLLQAYLGWQVPLTGMKHWILGLPDPVHEILNMVLDENAQISELSQAGWQVKYGRYTQANELSLPAKIEMKNENLKVKLVIKKWELSQ
jgi:outer membrane lipoprotein LolB